MIFDEVFPKNIAVSQEIGEITLALQRGQVCPLIVDTDCDDRRVNPDFAQASVTKRRRWHCLSRRRPYEDGKRSP